MVGAEVDIVEAERGECTLLWATFANFRRVLESREFLLNILALAREGLAAALAVSGELERTVELGVCVACKFGLCA